MKDDAVTAPRFVLVGIASVAIDAAVYALLHGVLGPAPAKGISYVAGALFGYVANWKFTFGARRGVWTEAAFVATYAVSLALNVLVNSLLLGPVGPVVAFLASTIVSTIWNYVCLSRVVFKRRVPVRGAT